MKKKSLILSVFATTHNIISLAKDYPLNISAKADKDVAEIRISGVIHQWQNSASSFKEQIDDLLDKGIKNVNLYINTPGGSVFEANEIANEIRRFPGTIRGYGGALVASAGSYLAIICDTFELAENGQYMYHKPIGYIYGNEDKVTSDLKLLQNLTTQYRTAYSDKTGMSEDVIENNWSKGDVWLSAKEALEQKFITSISKLKDKIDTSQQALFTACGAPIIPEVSKKPKINKTEIMNRNEIISALKLSSDATDEQIQLAIKAQQEDAAKYKSLTEDNEKKQKQLAEMMVQAFVDSKQITADSKEIWVKIALKDFDSTKALLSTLPKPSKISGEIDNQQESGDIRANWTLQDYLDKDPQALDALAEKDPAKFEKLNNEHYQN